MDNEPNNHQTMIQNGADRLLDEDYAYVVSLLDKYRNFTREFVFDCTCVRASEESLTIGAHFNGLEREYKLLMRQLGKNNDPIPPAVQVIIPKKMPVQNFQQQQNSSFQQDIPRIQLLYSDCGIPQLQQRQQTLQIQQENNQPTSNHHQMSFNNSAPNRKCSDFTR